MYSATSRTGITTVTQPAPDAAAGADWRARRRPRSIRTDTAAGPTNDRTLLGNSLGRITLPIIVNLAARPRAAAPTQATAHGASGSEPGRRTSEPVRSQST